MQQQPVRKKPSHTATTNLAIDEDPHTREVSVSVGGRGRKMCEGQSSPPKRLKFDDEPARKKQSHRATTTLAIDADLPKVSQEHKQSNPPAPSSEREEEVTQGFSPETSRQPAGILADQYDGLDDHNKKVLQELIVGDLVEFPRLKGIYSHWAVYVGNGDVIHLGPDENENQVDSYSLEITMQALLNGGYFHKASVKKDKFKDVVGKSKAKKNNKKDDRFVKKPTQQILHTAETNLGKMGYHILYKNCEHFASWCRYHHAVGDQADRLLKTLRLPREKKRRQTSTEFQAGPSPRSSQEEDERDLDEDSKRALKKLSEGDLIEITRTEGVDSHWAVYIGKGKVVHMAGQKDDIRHHPYDPYLLADRNTKCFPRAFVSKDKLKKVVGHHKAKINNGKDGQYTAQSKDKITERALTKRGMYAYKMEYKNAEHFASWCRYGDQIGEEACKFIERLGHNQ